MFIFYISFPDLINIYNQCHKKYISWVSLSCKFTISLPRVLSWFYSLTFFPWILFLKNYLPECNLSILKGSNRMCSLYMLIYIFCAGWKHNTGVKAPALHVAYAGLIPGSTHSPQNTKRGHLSRDRIASKNPKKTQTRLNILFLNILLKDIFNILNQGHWKKYLYQYLFSCYRHPAPLFSRLYFLMLSRAFPLIPKEKSVYNCWKLIWAVTLFFY